jgi:hypothetical protein
VSISEASRCQLFALRVQRPFHKYHDSVYSEVSRLMPEPQSLFVEPSRRQQNHQASMLLTGGTVGSPGKGAGEDGGFGTGNGGGGLTLNLAPSSP